MLPPEIAFDETLTVRAYYRPYSPSLTAADYEDFTGAPYVTIAPAPNQHQATVELHTRREIHALHLLAVRYKHLPRLHGHAVPISFAFRPPAGSACAPPPQSFSAGVLFEAGPPAGTTSAQPELRPLVNLLLYTRDLGFAYESNGFQRLSHAGDSHNLPSGNVVLEVPVVATNGHGENLRLSLTYNSVQASYQDSLELFQSLNAISPADLQRLYCPNPLGKGWTHSYNLYVREYVKPWELHPDFIDRHLELGCPDGNRIQFRAARQPLPASGAIEYRPELASDMWMGSATLGHSLTIERSSQSGQVSYVLSTMYEEKWIFNGDGDLVEMTDRLITNSPALRPLRVEQQRGLVRITDSRGRVATIRQVPTDPSASGQTYIEDPVNRTWLTYEGGRLQQISRAFQQTWSFAYHSDLGQKGRSGGTPTRCSLLARLTDPNGIESTYEYFDGGDEFDGVRESGAADFWGRLRKVARDPLDDVRVHRWRYKPLDSQRQQVVYRNPGRTEFIYMYDPRDQAVRSVFYIVRLKDPATLALTDHPSYEDVLAGLATPLPTARIKEYEYYSESKLVARYVDVQGNITRMEYVPGSVFLLARIFRPGDTVVEIDYDADHQVHKTYNPRPSSQPKDQTRFTELLYDTRGNLTTKRYPDLGGTVGILEESWVHDPPTGHLVEHHDLRGIVWTFGYAEADRDPHDTGLPTSKSVTKQIDVTPETLTWELTYERGGRVRESYDPLFGEVTRYGYHDLGPLNQIDVQPIPTAGGSERGATVHYGFDRLLQRERRSGDQGSEQWKYNYHGEIERYVDPVHKATERRYHKTGVPSSVTDADGHETTFVIDELDRVVRINYPAPDDRTNERKSPPFTDVFVYDDAAAGSWSATVEQQRYIVDAIGERVRPSMLRLVARKSFRAGLLGEQSEHHGFGAPEVRITYEPDAWQGPRVISFWDGQETRRVITVTRDSWGRDVGRVEEGRQKTPSSTRRSRVVLDAFGQVAEQYPPAIPTAHAGDVPRLTFRRDELGRLLEVKDSYGVVTRAFKYFDFGNNGDPAVLASRLARREDWGQDPSVADATDRLILLEETHFNRRGLPTTLHLGAAATASGRRQFDYNAGGELALETDEHGVTRDITADALGRPVAVKIDRRSKKAGIGWSDFDPGNPDHVEITTEVMLYAYGGHGEITEIRGPAGTETRQYDRLNRLNRITRPGSAVEEVAHDVADRIVGRWAAGRTHTFRYLDATRVIEATYRDRASSVVTVSTYDWDAKIKEFRYRENLGVGIGPYNKVYLRYGYSAFGKLETKEYVSVDNDVVLGKLTATYNDADLRVSTEVRVERPGASAYTHADAYQYDANFRLVQMDGRPGFSKFLLRYNQAGLVKTLGRPHVVATAGAQASLANTTVFGHDDRGRLVSIVDRAGPDTQSVVLTEIALVYAARPLESWEPPAAFDVNRKDLLLPTTSAVRGVTYRRPFVERLFPGTRNVFTQDVAYTGTGQVLGSTTRFSDVLEVYVDSRVTEWDPLDTIRTSARHERRYDFSQHLTSSVDFTETTEAVFGAPALVLSRHGERTPSVPKLEPKAFRETNRYERRQLSERWAVDEDLTLRSVTQSMTEGQQIHRTFVHDALDRLMGSTERGQIRDYSTDFSPGSSYKDSLPVVALHQYDPQGEDMHRSVRYWTKVEDQPVREKTKSALTITDGGAVVAEYDYDAQRVRFYRTIPGLGLRLAATTEWVDPVLGGQTYYYRWDPKGSTLLLTDGDGDVKGDFLLTSPEGERDLFGFASGPNQPGAGSATRDERRELWSHYVAAGPRPDLGIAHAATLQDRAERIAAYSHPAIAVGARNNYGFTAGVPLIYDGPIPNLRPVPPQPPDSFAVTVSEFTWGVIDSVSFGLTKAAREHFFDEFTSGAYFLGEVTGFAVSLLLGVGELRAAGWAAKALRGYRVSGEVIAVVQSSYHAATGSFTVLDTAGFLPTIGWGLGITRALRRARSIDLATEASVAQVKNATRARPRRCRSSCTLDPDDMGPGRMKTGSVTTWEYITGHSDEIESLARRRAEMPAHIPWQVVETTEILRDHARIATERALVACQLDPATGRIVARMSNGRTYRLGPKQSIQTFLGDRIDDTFKDLIARAPAGTFPVGELLPTARGRSGPDVINEAFHAAWDITTGEQGLAHVRRDLRWFKFYFVLDY
ncbi:MAG: hypothetical protein HYX76_13015 [Acidobacteria bacterium]|nr:hypothetical protein [Acidobacteriota bacterium]